MAKKDSNPSYPPAPDPIPPAAPRMDISPRKKKKSSSPATAVPRGNRLVSLDAYRGFIMIMLAASGFGFSRFAALDQDNAVWNTWNYERFQAWNFHFTHPPWESIRGWMSVSFWDMIQPSFMFMVGVAMPFSYARRQTMGSSSGKRLIHAMVRAILLVLLGVFLSSQRGGHTNWVFANVLCQIGLGYIFAYLLLGRSPQIQVAAIAVILVGYWGWFILNPPPENYDFAAVSASAEDGEVFEGRFAPWSKNGNAAHFVDVAFLNNLRTPPETTEEPGLMRRWWFSDPKPFEFNGGGYATLNFIPSIATTILGILCGQLLLSPDTDRRKLLTLLVMGAACLGLGILAHHTVCPIVKRIWTPSWVLFAGGYTIWILAGFYFLFDVLPLKKLAFPLVVVGMNSIAMYMMGQLLRGWVSTKVVQTHFGGMLQSFFGPGAVKANDIGAIVLPTATFLVFWLVAYWLYRNRWFVRI